MTNEEAVEVLEDMKVTINIPKAAELQRKRNEAIDMAIKALSNSEIPNNSDMVYRQAAIDALNKKKIYRQLDSDRWVISDCLNAIAKLPSIQPEVLVKEEVRSKKYSIPVEVEFDDSIVKELGNLQTYKLSEGDDMILVDLADVVDVMVSHIKVKEKKVK